MSESVSGIAPSERPPLEPTDAGGLDAAGALALLCAGAITVTGRLVDASNATLYCEISHDGVVGHCVYKPVRGERALWDFPDGTLAGREQAAYLVSEATGAGIVPPTVLRDGPFGAGMVQLWIDTDETVDLVALTRSDDPQLRAIALFDAVVNNADRKGSHLLPGPSGRIYGIDHGVTFHAENKLRTLLWTWRGQRLRADELELLTRLRVALSASGAEPPGQRRRDNDLPASPEAPETEPYGQRRRDNDLPASPEAPETEPYGQRRRDNDPPASPEAPETEPPGRLATALVGLLTQTEIESLRARIERLLTERRFPVPSGDWPPIPWPPF
ncbi:SCO1664 family protein [Frankia sp. Cj5]|uniref:SCO1664 family protein n=1 Tax=Frankia sp. Cj5 TaxID=2880978 RepID=UPI001EF70FF5|nr:SCO1664 family protein [Frankia sp. Cj5]